MRGSLCCGYVLTSEFYCGLSSPPLPCAGRRATTASLPWACPAAWPASGPCRCRGSKARRAVPAAAAAAAAAARRDGVAGGTCRTGAAGAVAACPPPQHLAPAAPRLSWSCVTMSPPAAAALACGACWAAASSGGSRGSRGSAGTGGGGCPRRSAALRCRRWRPPGRPAFKCFCPASGVHQQGPMAAAGSRGPHVSCYA